MPTITIDGTEYQVADGRTILQAMDDLGLLMNEVEIPHYCWHPKLSVDGSCRLCQVEVEGIPKLQIACNTPVRDGMVVRTRNEKVLAAREAVLELLLLNHPLDCPICDQAGECKLQDFAFDWGPEAARTREPRRPAKKRVDLGPTIVFDQERCILCRRCVRFCREISKTGELGVFQRGDESRIEVFPGARLDNPYSMNVADICPVGALTTKDFRFKIRAWFLEDVESICNQCANGCNLWASRSNNKVYRFLPRRNDPVNDTWICDHGRLSYELGGEGRLEQARVDGHPVTPAEAVARAGELLRQAIERKGRIVGVASPFAANEDLFVLRKLLAAVGADPAVFALSRGEADGFLIRAERAANAQGARELGFTEAGASLGTAALGIALGHEVPSAAFGEVEDLILIDTHESALTEHARVVLPARYFLEKHGTFTNHARRAQAFRAVVEPRFEAWAEGEILARIAAGARVAGFDAQYDVRAVSKELSEAVPAFRGRDLGSLGAEGSELA
jgi:NADH-quinone oxidoreductase subunit G